MTGYYNLSLVALSLAIATIASYTTLDLANRVSANASTPRKAWLWLAAGAISMGTGIWAMHFIGMLAFHLPIPIAYDLGVTGASMLIAVAVSAIALFVLRQPRVTTRSWLLGATFMGIGISAMHYSGMLAMRMLPAIRYDLLLFITSVLIATLAALAALWIALKLRGNVSRFVIPAKLASAGVMGLAITGMHYTGMAAAQFAPASVCLAAVRGGLQNTTIAIIIGCIAMAILSLTIVLATLDAHFAQKNERLAASLQVAKDAADAALRENEKITAQLRAAQSELLGAARRAGMAEIANGVLHNVGNVLNSVNVSAQLIETRVRESKTGGIGQAVQLMSEHAAQLGDFLSNDPRGQRLPGYLGKLAESLAADKSAVLDELSALTRSIEHIKEIVGAQQSYAGANSILEPVRIDELVEDAVRMAAGAKSSTPVTIIKDLQPAPAVLLDKHLMLQILINLITNARQAMDGVPERPHEIRIGSEFTGVDEGRLLIHVEDNGEGIEPDTLTRLFVHGFTTRKAGHGFGLHSSALAAKTLGGTLTARSEGLGHGAVFTLEVAVKGRVESHEYA